MTPFDALPLVLFGALWMGAYRLDHPRCKTSSISSSASSSSAWPSPTSGAATVSARSTTREESVTMPSFMRQFEGIQ